MPRIYGMELEDGHDLGLDATPSCCSDEMEGKDREDGGREYTCGDCGTELIVSPNGLVFDIYEGAA
ncbi:hypothetical protein [Streptomyces acidicola]|uniref:Uncharacterized protein n=1 Tax=Streptomyces acidicola TaxID=2596892 RepID=A0A5N8WIT0_9ACTN|nr:hypothetical protein [Streptomyces acidicola]MPY47139.1 hypothetical protein [Streptomyces acidicola]MPY47278.1 hypothetical protein [Streptomyces acidicola]